MQAVHWATMQRHSVRTETESILGVRKRCKKNSKQYVVS